MDRPPYGKGALNSLIQKHLSDHPDQWPREIAPAVDTSVQNVTRVLRRQLREGVVRQDIYGRYRLIVAEDAGGAVARYSEATVSPAGPNMARKL